MVTVVVIGIIVVAVIILFSLIIGINNQLYVLHNTILKSSVEGLAAYNTINKLVTGIIAFLGVAAIFALTIKIILALKIYGLISKPLVLMSGFLIKREQPAI